MHLLSDPYTWHKRDVSTARRMLDEINVFSSLKRYRYQLSSDNDFQSIDPFWVQSDESWFETERTILQVYPGVIRSVRIASVD